MTRASQKEEELETVDRYLEVTGIKGTASINPKTNEPPDIFVEQDGICIGVEVTQYHAKDQNASGFTRTEVEASWKKIQEYVLNLAEKNSWIFDYDVSLDLKNELVPNNKETPAFVEAIINQILANKAQIVDKDVVFQVDQSWPDIIRKYLQKFYVCKTRCKKSWDSNLCWRRLGTSDEELLKVIRNKLSYVPPPNLQKNWLIIYGGADLPTMFDVPWVGKIESFNQFNLHLSKSRYDVVALLGFRTWLKWERGNGWGEIQTDNKELLQNSRSAGS
ncbi:MAG: hypothetical protein WC464_06725 [Bdellovibrionales bacterium]